MLRRFEVGTLRQPNGSPAPNKLSAEVSQQQVGAIQMPKKMKKSVRRTPLPESHSEDTGLLPLTCLHLDGSNPRLGAKAGHFKSEAAILDAIVEDFGIDNVLSSLAVNGYFEAEPLVGVRIDSENVRIAEGNRRLAACLILVGDPRAKSQHKRTVEYQELQRKHKRPPIHKVPVRILEDDKSLLSYLGVRHIAASQPWDSFAKAAWVAKVLEAGQLTLEDISQMIGDQHRTVARSLEGYYVVNQLVKSARFVPSESQRPGRGSNPEYPFSWVYTSLGMAPIREWLGLAERSQDGRDKEPLKSAGKLDDAASLLTMLYGNKKQAPAINDSRQIADLARAIANPESRRMLKRGETVANVAELLKPAKERVADSLLDAQESLRNALSPLSQGELGADAATELLEPSRKVRNLATEVNKQLLSAAKFDLES